MGKIIVEFALAHKAYVIATAVTALLAVSNVRAAVRYLFELADSFPQIHAIIVQFAPQEKEAVDAAAAELKQDIDGAVQKDAPKP